MPGLLSGGKALKGTTGTTSIFITLPTAQLSLGNTPSTGTGFTLVTGQNGLLGFTSTLGSILFQDGIVQSNIPNGNITIQSTGTGTLSLNGNVLINGKDIASLVGTITNFTAVNATITNLTVTGSIAFTSATNTATFASSVLIKKDLSVEQQLIAKGNVQLSPDAGLVQLKPGFGGSVEIYPSGLGRMDNTNIGDIAPANGRFVELTATNFTVANFSATSFATTTGTFELVQATNIQVTNSLTAGQVYKVGVRNYNSANGIGSYTICVKSLKRGGCDYGAGPYTLCQYFKATYAGATGVNYTYTFTGTSGPAAGNTYTRTQNSDICVLSNVTPTLPYGSTFNLLISNTYTIADAAGATETLTVSALAPCTVSTSAQPVTALKAADQCSAGQKFRGATVASLPWVCGATNWRWKFQELDASLNPVGLPIEVNRNSASNYISLGTITQLQYGKTYAVQTAPILAYTGTNYAWGPAFNMCIIGAAGMIVDASQDVPQGSTKAASQDVAQGMELNIYPNPSNGNNIQLMLSGIDAQVVQVRMLDAMGKQIWVNKYNSSELSNTSIEFAQSLSDGLYFIQIVSGKETISQRFLVRK